MGAGETLNGGSGNNTIIVTAATIGDTINGGSGRSTLQFGGGGNVTLGSNITNIAVLQLKAAATAYDAVANSIAGLTVLDSDTANADTIQAGGATQTLTGGGAGKLTFIGAANTDFADTITLFNHDTIQNFLVGDSIDLTNLGFTAAGTGSGQTNLSFSSGALSVMLGSAVQTSINIAGSVNAAKFTIGSDGGAGTLLTYHA
jgi:Ca2+-binding RTX toxin-like protein